MELPVLQLQQSHELHVDLKALGSADAMLAVVPYQAMAEGDKVTFIYQAYFDGFDDPFVDWEFTEEVATEQVGQAILAVLPNSVLKSAEGLNGRMYYRIAYKDVADESTSPVQLNFPVREVLPAPDLLAPPFIKTLVGMPWIPMTGLTAFLCRSPTTRTCSRGRCGVVYRSVTVLHTSYSAGPQFR